MSLDDFAEDNMPTEGETGTSTTVETKSTRPCEKGSLLHTASYALHCRAHNKRCYYTHNCGELKEYLETIKKHK